MAGIPSKPPREPARDMPALIQEQSAYHLPRFTVDDAFALGVSLRERVRSITELPCVINITGANSEQLLFHTVTRSGAIPDHDLWVARKRKTVKRWGVSSWFMGRRFEGNQEEFAKKYMLGTEAGSYAIHGGGVPVFVEGVEGLVAVVVVSGMKQEYDHMVVIESLEELGTKMRRKGGRVDAATTVSATKNGKKSDDRPKQADTLDAQAILDEQKADGAVLAS